MKKVEAIIRKSKFSSVKKALAINYLIDNKQEINKQDAKQKLKLFYWANIFTQNYSGSTESKSARDYVLLQNWFNNNDKEPEVIQDFKRRYKDLNLINEKSQGSSIYKAILNLIVLNNSRDFISYDLPDYSELDDHHIVPNSWGKKNNIENINSILNRTLITLMDRLLEPIHPNQIKIDGSPTNERSSRCTSFCCHY